MPYIDKEDREEFESIFETVEDSYISSGQLNYLVSRLCHKYLEDNGNNYETFNSIVGVLECAKLEFYRHLVGPYEQEKIEQNGDL